MSETHATIHHGDCRNIIATLPDCSVDSIVTDPPYELGFMGKQWDGSGIAYDQDLWRQCLRVLKPGGHLLAFGGTRTYHRMAVAIEDAGFEIRDSIHWLYGSGFPKSLDVSKAIDKAAGAERTLQIGTSRGVAVEDSKGYGGIARGGVGITQKGVDLPVMAPATDAARQWEGWGTALKPAHEPILVARKPLSGTVAATVLEHGTGALNIDGCRVAGADTTTRHNSSSSSYMTGKIGEVQTTQETYATGSTAGRWPANLVLTHAADCADQCAPDCPIPELDTQSGVSKSPDGLITQGGDHFSVGSDKRTRGTKFQGHGDSGGASRFFTVTEWDSIADIAPFRYVAKPSRAERDAGLAALPLRDVHRLGAGIGEGADPQAPSVDRNHHPTVKPLALMRWLVRLVTPPGGTVLEPFAGSGTTMAAAIMEDRHVIGCELTADYLPIIEGRIAWAHTERNNTPDTLFDPTE